MNKLFIVLLAVCLFSVISAHPFVKRDAPATDAPPAADDLAAKVNSITAQITKMSTDIGQQIAAAVNPDTIKKNLNDAIDAATKAFEKLKKPEGAATPAA